MPTAIPQVKENAVRNVAINEETGEVEDEQAIWESSAWARMERSRGKSEIRHNFVGHHRASFFERSAVVVVDPFSTAAHLAAAVCEAGYKCIRVLSMWDSPVAALVQKGLAVDFIATVQHNDRNPDQEEAVNATIQALNALPLNILAVIAGAETGVELADKLSFRMGFPSNGEEKSLARRNKFLMGEAVREAGVRAVKQKLCYSLADMSSFLDTFDTRNFKCVVKPVQSAGTDDVYLCRDKDEAAIAFSRIVGKRNGIGLINDGALVQEFLEGKEYVVDKVSRNGVHKLVAIWEYDKRSVNGANFVYFGMRLHSSKSPKAQAMVEYADKVLDALGVVCGPSHMEIMYNEESGPCLVEVGARCHGGEGTWLKSTMECVGYTQVSVTLDSYLDGKLFDSIDAKHFPLTKHAREVDICSRYGGIVRGFPGEPKIRALPSFRSMSWEVSIGDYAPKTVDCFTRPGCVQLVHECEQQAEEDLEEIHRLEVMGLIDYAVICPKAPVVGAVVIVDPFSTGANMAATIVQWGYKLILVFAERDSPVAKLVAKGTNLTPTLIIQHDSGNPDQDAAIAETLSLIGGQGAPVLAILPGAETGVELADKLSARFGTRSNGEEYTAQRRNKYLMQEAIRNAGVRAIKQQLCNSEAEVKTFYASLGNDAVCVLKPNESAGSDSVYKCANLNECLDAFNHISGHKNGLGQVNRGALCQEFLRGTEFVVDGVSRDGVYKVTAIWQYDKRSVNNANFVYFGMRLISAATPVAQALIGYARQVVAALHILHGPSHMEVYYHPENGPCLVEVGSRCHGGEATWLPVAQECVGYTQLEATLNCYLRPDRFDAIPFEPSVLLKEGCEAFLVSMHSGMLRDIPGVETIRNMRSFRRMELNTQPGEMLVPTVDCFTRPGSVQMVCDTAAGLEADYAKIRELETHGLFLTA